MNGTGEVRTPWVGAVPGILEEMLLELVVLVVVALDALVLRVVDALVLDVFVVGVLEVIVLDVVEDCAACEGAADPPVPAGRGEDALVLAETEA